REPPVVGFVTLSEALTWIAFGLSAKKDTYETALRDNSLGDKTTVQAKLERAVRQLTAVASDGKIALRGKHRASRHVHEDQLLTAAIDPIRLVDFARYDYSYDALVKGDGLFRTQFDGGTDQKQPIGDDGEFRWVTVNRAELMAAFPRYFEQPAELLVDPARAQVSPTSGGQKDCERWLLAQFADDPDEKRSKSWFKSEALQYFGSRLSGRAFVRVWEKEVSGTSRSRPGRKS
ncbi:MAG: hypothetical protein RL367_851, partial [Pseudomonadota bacterium]